MDWSFGDAGGVLIAALCGGAVGLERERSGHASDGTGADRHFAGLRTFTLLGALAGIAGLLWRTGVGAPAVALLGGAALLIAAAYLGASRHDVDGTTEVAALVVLAAGFVSGIGKTALASGITAGTVLLLIEKSRLHGWVGRLDDAEFRSGTRFAVMAAVVLPLLPEGPFGPGVGVKPRELWLIVLVITGLEFAGYLAQRRVGRRYGWAAGGLLGGLVSSTSVTLSYARLARLHPAAASGMAGGALAANAALFPRVAITALLLNTPLGLRLLPLLVAPFLVVVAALAGTLRAPDPPVSGDEARRNPMHVGPALQLALVYQLAIMVIDLGRRHLGEAGLLVTAFFLGMTDIDALTISSARQAGAADPQMLTTLARLIVAGALGTTLFKLGIALVVGRGVFRRRVAAAFVVLALVLGATLLAG